jgi:hypothetical protein
VSALKQMMFGVVEEGDGRIVSLHSVPASVEQQKHDAYATRDRRDYTIVNCSCGAQWSISPSAQINDEVRATFNSHLSYADKPKLVTL